MVELVERMLDPSAGSGQALHQQFPKAKTPHEQEPSSARSPLPTAKLTRSRVAARWIVVRRDDASDQARRACHNR